MREEEGLLKYKLYGLSTTRTRVPVRNAVCMLTTHRLILHRRGVKDESLYYGAITSMEVKEWAALGDGLFGLLFIYRFEGLFGHMSDYRILLKCSGETYTLEFRWRYQLREAVAFLRKYVPLWGGSIAP